MNNKKAKSIRTLIVILICLFVTILATVGICCYNYYGYVNYKVKYLDDYFEDANEKTTSTKERIEKILKWDAKGYSDKLNVTYRDPITKEVITDVKVSSDRAENVNAYYENYTLHLPKYFDINLYRVVGEEEDSDGVKKYTDSYYFYLSNINYNQIPDFEPRNLYMTFVEGIGEESDQALSDVVEELKAADVNTGFPPATYSYSITSEDGSSFLKSYFLLDNPVDEFKDEETEDGTTKTYYIYSNECRKSYGDEPVNFSETKALTFVLYYQNDTDRSSFKNLVEGTFEANLKDNKLITPEEFLALDTTYSGYNKAFYQESYRKFIMPKIILTGVITFLIVGVVSGVLATLWIYDPTSKQNASKTNNKTSKKKTKKQAN